MSAPGVDAVTSVPWAVKALPPALHARRLTARETGRRGIGQITGGYRLLIQRLLAAPIAV